MTEVYTFTENGDWDKLVKTSKGPIVIEFMAPWCAPCQELEPVIKRMQKEFTIVNFYKYNMDTLYYQANELGISGIPCMLLLLPPAAAGEEPPILDRVIGYMTADMLRPKLEALMQKFNGA